MSNKHKHQEEKVMVSNEVAKGAMALIHEPVITQEILKSDLVLPKILIMQGLSELVSQRKAQSGDIVRSTTAEKLGDDAKGIDFIPLRYSTDYALSEAVKGKYEWRRNEPRNAANEKADWEFEENGIKWRRTAQLHVFGLLPADIQAAQDELEKDVPDLEKTLLPVVISFRSTGFKAGKKIATLFARVDELRATKPNAAIYNYMVSIGCAEESNDLGNFFIPTVGAARAVDLKFIATARSWYERLAVMSDVKVDDQAERANASEFATSNAF